MDSVSINRAPVLTLWAAVVAERLGFDREEALTLSKAVAGLTAAIRAGSRSLSAACWRMMSSCFSGSVISWTASSAWKSCL